MLGEETTSKKAEPTVTVTATEPGTSVNDQASVVVTCDGPASTADASACSTDPGLGGIGAPAGTVVTASSSWNSNPAGTIDGTVTVGWNSGDYSGSLELTFPAPIALDGIALAAVSLPTTIETYTLTGLQGGTPVALGSFSDTVVTGFADELPPMMFAAGTYDGLRFDIQGNASWVSINELSLLTPQCPAGAGGLYDLSTGALADAGSATPDASNERDASSEGSNDGSSEGSSSNDAGGDVAAAEAGGCPPGADAMAPFPNFGTATLSGTIGAPGTTVAGPGHDCVSLVTSRSMRRLPPPATCPAQSARRRPVRA